MNYDLLTWVEYFVGAFACCFGSYCIAGILLKRNPIGKTVLNILKVVFLTLLTIVNSLIFDNVAKMFGVLIIIYCMYYFVYKEKNIISCFYLAIISYIIILLGETTYVLIASLIDFVFHVGFAAGIVKSILANFSISIISCLYARILKHIIIRCINKINNSNTVFTIILGIVSISIVLSTIYKLYLDKWTFGYSFILNLLVIFGCIVLLLTIIRQYLQNKEIADKYELLEDYMKTSADLIEKYSSTVHKYKNNLITIKGYMKSNMKDANNYIDSLLDNFQTKKYGWFSKINYIKIDTIRYLIYYKLSKAEESNLKISVTVSSDIKNFICNLLETEVINIILEILGEYFDNAIYASNESNERELNFNLYIENNALVFEIANTFKNQIDLEMITKNGYTTKGENHGFGLFDVDRIMKKYSILSNKYEVIDNYFIARIFVNVSEIMNEKL